MPFTKKVLVAALSSIFLAISSSIGFAADSPKSASDKIATVGCKQFTLSMTINDSFLNLSKTAQTKVKMKAAIAAENHALATALSAFKSAAKQDKKWKSIADKLETVIHTDKADAYTKSFAAVLASCSALIEVKKK